MNLNEERKAPLRGKDLSTKREMVVQYISATAKSVSERVNWRVLFTEEYALNNYIGWSIMALHMTPEWV